MPVDAERVRVLNEASPRARAAYVLYWMQMNRRVPQNHALAYAAALANANQLPLLVYEGLTFSYPSANDRLHTFVLEGVEESATRCDRLGAGYFFYLRRTAADPNDILYRLATRAHSVVIDDYPTFIAAHHNAVVPNKIGIPCIAVDSSCIVPMSVHEKRNYGAYTIRPKMKRELPRWMKPVEMPTLARSWEPSLLDPELAGHHTDAAQAHISCLVASCAINHSIAPSVEYRGGTEEARERLEIFLGERLRRYARESSLPSKHATSNLSPYLHFGNISALEVALAARAHAEEHNLIAEEFLEELIVRRELAFNFARFAGPQVESLEALPDWCHRTMAKHAADPRPWLYTPEQFENAQTHDPLWNATQRELLLRGTIHGYYRMYWGKKIIEWSPTYAEALRIMIHLHDVYALDGRDPNTYTNILWCFGLHDRPWGERPIFGQLRYMSYDGMKRKTDINAYINEIAILGLSNSSHPQKI